MDDEGHNSSQDRTHIVVFPVKKLDCASKVVLSAVKFVGVVTRTRYRLSWPSTARKRRERSLAVNDAAAVLKRRFCMQTAIPAPMATRNMYRAVRSPSRRRTCGKENLRHRSDKGFID
jgi:hypothetical protein